MSSSSARKLKDTLLATTLNKGLFLIVVIGILFALAAPFTLSSPQCTNERTQQERDAVGCIVGADFGPGIGMFVGLGLAASALSIALVLEAKSFKRQPFLVRSFLLIPLGMVFLFFAFMFPELLRYINR